MISLLAFLCSSAFADPTQTLMLQELVNKASQQVETARQLVENSKNNGRNLEQAARVLTELSQGLNQSIANYQGTQVYEKALIKAQQENVTARNSAPNDAAAADRQQEFDHRFINQSTRANGADLEAQANLAKALQTAGPGFVSKLQTQAQIGSWQTNTRVSAQLNELLSALHDIHHDLRNGHEDHGLREIMRGMAYEKSKQVEGPRHGL